MSRCKTTYQVTLSDISYQILLCLSLPTSDYYTPIESICKRPFSAPATWQRISCSISSYARSQATFISLVPASEPPTMSNLVQDIPRAHCLSLNGDTMYPSGRKPIEHRIHNCQIQSELSSSNHLVLGFHFRSHMLNRVKSVDSLGFTIAIPPKYPKLAPF